MYNMGLGRIGNYISQGVNSVSAPFHPFGGAVDIIVVEQQDGSFKSSPWYVRFGKFQGVLKAKEKLVKINVNGAEADFHMYLDHKGEAYFLRELDGEEGDPVLCPSSSGEETDEQSRNRRPVKFKSSNYDASLSNSVAQIDVTDGKVVTRTNSRRSRILGLVFGKKSMKNDSRREQEDGPDVVRRDSLERAEFAADLLEVKWSTNLASNRGRKGNASWFSAPNIPGSKADKDLPINDGQGEMYTPLQNSMTNSLNDSVLRGKIGFHDSGIINSKFGFQKLGSSDEDLGVEMSCLDTEHIVETCALGESGLQENYLNSRTVREIDEFGVASANPDENAKCFIPETISPDPESTERDSCLSQKLDEEQVLKEYTNLPGQGVSEDESGEDRVEAFVYCETSETSRVGLHNAGVNLGKALYVSCRGCAEVCVHAATLHQASELISGVTSGHETSLLVAKEPLDAHKILADGNCGNFSNEAKIIDSKGTSSNSIANSLVSETYTQVVTVNPINVSAKEVEPCSICTISGFNNSAYEAQKEENYGDEDKMSKLQHSSKSIGNFQEFRSNNVSTGAITSSSPSEDSEGEPLLFGDLDDFNHGEVKCMESISSDHVEKGNGPSGTSEGNKAVIESVDLNFESYSSPDMFVQENIPNHVEDVIQKSRMVSNYIKIPRSNEVTAEDVERMAESLPNMRFDGDNLVVDDLHHSLGHSLDSNSESSKWTTLRGDSSSCIKPGTDKDIASHTQSTANDAQNLEELKHVPANPAVGNLSSKRSWRGWPFSFKRSKSLQTTQPAQNSSRRSGAENSSESSIGMDGEKDVLKTKMKMKKVREIAPTPEQLASLNLKQGKNIVTFTFSTSMLGAQQVDARIYLWKWDTRVVISDVDGTITKSDVLGQFMPFVGVDWSQSGVAHLFSAIKENGYQLLFLSARAISQAYHTRQFLFNLKQDGKGLPDGPVVISPDGLFPSLFREVIRRAPHEFKIGCLEDIRVLFPSDRNPFYAGFGNRDTDEISYLKVGIPIGKIFIINPKGEVVVNRRVDSKSYTSLHALVHDMFPPMTSEQEDFNSWNYWKLPPPAIDI